MKCGLIIAVFLLSPLAAAPVQPATAYQPVPPRERLVGIAYSNWFRTVPWQNVWGTPELGFYTSDDRNVIRQHAIWLADAGVDFVWLDWCSTLNYISDEDHEKEKSRPASIERSTHILFEEYAKLSRRPRISIFLGVPGAPEAVADGRLQRKADEVYRIYVANPVFRPLLQDYLGKPLLVVYVNTPSPFQKGIPTWSDPRFTVRWMTGYVTDQRALRTPDLVSRYGYWSWEDRGPQTFSVHEGRPEAMVVVASWRPNNRQPGEKDYIAPGLRNHGATFHAQWDRARSVGPRFAMVVSWNEWTKVEQPSAENSKDLEPSKEWGRLYLDLLKSEIAKFKGR